MERRFCGFQCHLLPQSFQPANLSLRFQSCLTTPLCKPIPCNKSLVETEIHRWSYIVLVLFLYRTLTGQLLGQRARLVQDGLSGMKGTLFQEVSHPQTGYLRFIPRMRGRGVGGGAKGNCGGMPGSQSIASEMACQHLFLILLAKARLTGTDSRLQNKTHLSRRGYADDICKGKNAGRVNM